MRIPIFLTAMIVGLGQLPDAQIRGDIREVQWSSPAWGQYGNPTWGQYNGTLGASGWQFKAQGAPAEPTSSIILPNQATSSFANPRTGRSLFTPPDTRFKGRDRP